MRNVHFAEELLKAKETLFVLQLPQCITANLTAKGTPVKGTPPGAHFNCKWPRDEKKILLVGSHGVSASQWDWVVHGVISQPHFCVWKCFSPLSCLAGNQQAMTASDL